MILVTKTNGEWGVPSGIYKPAGVAPMSTATIKRLVADGVWDTEDLEQYGLRQAIEFVVPDGKVVSGSARYVEQPDGSILQEFDVVDIVPAPPSTEFLARDLFYQFTAVDMARLQIAIEDESAAARAAIAAEEEPSTPLRLLWDSLTAQGEWKIRTTSQEFKSGWAAMIAILGATRMTEVAAALYIDPDAQATVDETP